ncbi:XdhC family protein [Sphingomonas sp. CLY1604]|uniref:XdhC family protein n=1 Tax=Sphingomonas sp. CLY1604 TaxID=3457786 RepID=UPI003FD85546
MKQALSILRFLSACAQRGEPAALVTLTDVTASAVRRPGEHMAIAADGSAIGSFSGGCIEAAVIAEAQEALADGAARLVRYGAGSRYIDIRLPCGGGIDLLFTPRPNPAVLAAAIATLEAREPLGLRLTRDGGIDIDAADRGTGWAAGGFHVRHDPDPRVAILGQGAEPLALLDVARAYGAGTLLLSPQEAIVAEAQARGSDAALLRVLGPSPALAIDRWTAVVALFHDHDWETGLLLQALDQRPFFIGAMGSLRTQAERRRRLAAAGGEAQAIDRIVGPIGLIHATRDPATLAISIMAQVAEAYEAFTAERAVTDRRDDGVERACDELCASSV